MTKKYDSTRNAGIGNENFNEMLPRSIFAESSVTSDRLDKTASTFTGFQTGPYMPGVQGEAGNILRNPARRFYHPEFTTTAVYLPRDIKQKNRWRRWFYDHDEFIGTVLDLHADLPYSYAEIEEEDPYIKQAIEDCFDNVNMFSMLPIIDLEYLKIGEVVIHTPWDSKKGMWDSIVIHNPDYVEIKFSPFADQDSVVELIPDEELRTLVHSTKPEDQELKRRLPKDIIRNVLTGRNISLDSAETTHLARRSNPYDVRGTSIIDRIFRTLIYEDKLRESQITIADNFIYPLKIFKLGDAQKGWIPNSDHQQALAQMLQQATFDPNFALIYHYALNVDYVTVADKVMRLDQEWGEIDKRKGIALGISQEMIQGQSTYACFVEGTEISTPDGIKEIQDLSKGDEVIDKDGYIKKVIDNWEEGVPEEIIEIKLWGNKTIQCTSNHKWPVWAWKRDCICGCGGSVKAGKLYTTNCKKKRWNDGTHKYIDMFDTTGMIDHKYPKTDINHSFIQKLNAEDIKTYDYVMVPRKYDVIKTNVTEDEARLLGYFVAEGNFSKHARTKEITGLNLTFSIHEENTWIKDSVDILTKIGIPVRDVEKRKSSCRIRTVDRVEFNNKVMWFKKHAGEYSHSKKLSEEVMRWPINLKKELIKGLFRGDGCQIENKGSLHYTSISKELINQIELILAQLGYHCNLIVQKEKRTDRKTLYRLDVGGKFAFDLAKMIWGKSSVIKEHNFVSQKAFVDENYVYVQVKSVNKVKNTKKVYNITVEGTHSYLAKNVGTYNSANVGLQTQLARYRTKRDYFEQRWIRDKFLKGLAEKNEWYRRDKREIRNNFRVSRKGRDLEERLVVPKLVWQKKLMLRDDQSYLTFMNQVYQNGKGPISAITLLQAMGLDLNDELNKKKRTQEAERKFGVNVHPPVGGSAGLTGGITANVKSFFGFGRKKEAEENVEELTHDDTLITASTDDAVQTTLPAHIDIEYSDDIEQRLHPANDAAWFLNLESPSVPSEVIIGLTNLKSKLDSINKKYDDFNTGVLEERDPILRILFDLYIQGKLTAYNWTNFLPVYKEYYEAGEDLKDFSDLMMGQEFESWLYKLVKNDKINATKPQFIRNLGANAFAFGQLKGFQEQGIYNVKLSNVFSNDGLRYKVGELLIKGMNLTSLISPKDEIAIFAPMIEGFDEDFDNNVDPHIQRYSNFSVSDITVEKCPVEYEPFVRRYLNKFGKYLKKSCNKIEFVRDVIDLSEWEESQKKKLEEEHKHIDPKDKDVIIASQFVSIKARKRGKEAVFINNKKAYISSWIGMEDHPITDNLIKHLDIFDDNVYKDVKKVFKKANYDLNENELSTHKIFDNIEPLSDDPVNPRGYKISAKIMDNPDDYDDKLVKGKIWDTTGRCINSNTKDAVSIFKDNIKLWVEYPHLLDKDIKRYYEEL